MRQKGEVGARTAAKMLGCDYRTVLRWIRGKGLRKLNARMTVTGRFYVPKTEIERLLRDEYDPYL